MQLKLIFNGRVLTALVMLVIFATMSLLALGFPENARLMPLMIGVPGTLLGLTQLVIEVRTAMAELPELHGENAAEVRRDEIQMFTWIFLFFAGILCFGFINAAPFLVFGFMYLAKKETLTAAVIGAIGTWAVLYGFFQTWFEIQLFDGLVIEWLFA